MSPANPPAPPLSLSGLAILLFVVAFVVSPMEHADFRWLSWLRVVLEAALTLTVVSAATAVTGRLSVGLVSGALVLATIVTRQWERLAPGRGVALADGLLSALAFGVLLILVLALAFRSGPVTGHRIVGAVLGYLLFAVVFGHAYAIVELCAADAFNVGGLATSASRRASLMYLSVMTLTTAGYGDITPLHPAARAIAMVEAIVGQLFPVVYIGRLVALTTATGRST